MPRVPDPILNNLRCVDCERWLSCGPVRVITGGASICGRCLKTKSVGPSFRHFAYEAIANYFRYPCVHFNRGCNAELEWNDVSNHEKSCRYRASCLQFFVAPSYVCKRERKLELDQMYTLAALPDSVTEFLRCDSCDLYLSSPPISVCKDGTSRCHRCGPPPGEPTTNHDAFDILAGFALFPCIFYLRGCTNKSKFGPDVVNHEADCAFSRHLYLKRTQNVASVSPPIKKERGVIQTHSGHIYATLTSSSVLFAPPDKTISKKEQEKFLNNFRKHRHDLANRWGKDEICEEDDDPEWGRDFPKGLQKSPRYSEDSGEDEEDNTPAGVSRNESFMRKANFDENRYSDFIGELREKQKKVLKDHVEMRERKIGKDRHVSP